MDDVVIRPVAAGDAEAIRRIYNHEVEHTTHTFDLVPRTLEDQRAWLRDREGALGVVVAEVDGEVAGFASLSDAHPRLKAGWQALQELHGLYTADDYDGALEALGRFCDLYETGELPEFHDTHTGGALSVGLGLTLSTTGPSGAFTMICRPGPAGGARTDRSEGM